MVESKSRWATGGFLPMEKCVPVAIPVVGNAAVQAAANADEAKMKVAEICKILELPGDEFRILLAHIEHQVTKTTMNYVQAAQDVYDALARDGRNGIVEILQRYTIIR